MKVTQLFTFFLTYENKLNGFRNHTPLRMNKNIHSVYIIYRIHQVFFSFHFHIPFLEAKRIENLRLVMMCFYFN